MHCPTCGHVLPLTGWEALDPYEKRTVLALVDPITGQIRPNKEIAHVLNISEGTVKTAMCHATAKLKMDRFNIATRILAKEFGIS